MVVTLAFVNPWVAFCAAIWSIVFYETLCNCDHQVWKFDWNCDYHYWKFDLDLFVKFFSVYVFSFVLVVLLCLR